MSIAYYLTHRQDIEEYLQQQETAANVLQEQLESNPDPSRDRRTTCSYVGPVDRGYFNLSASRKTIVI